MLLLCSNKLLIPIPLGSNENVCFSLYYGLRECATTMGWWVSV